MRARCCLKFSADLSALWLEDAKEFNPERFAQGVYKATKSNQAAYFPFGWGPRLCLGQNFAMLEAKLAVKICLESVIR